MSSLKIRTTAATTASIDDIKSTARKTFFETTKKSYTAAAAWWIKNPPEIWTQKQRQQPPRKQSFSTDMSDLFRNISLHGYSKLLDPELALVEKLIWLLLHGTMMTFMLIVLSFTWEQFVAQYFVINLHDPLYPVENVPFPAVSICSNNRISNAAAIAYAQRLNSKDPRKRGVSYFLEHIKDFSRLYYRYLSIEERGKEYGFEDDDNFLDFQAFLEEYDTMENETFFDTRKVMMMLTPKCKDFILQCLLAGVEINCFSSVAFSDSLSLYGPCCTFNVNNTYRRRASTESFVSSNLGLTVVLNTSHADDFRQIFSSDGYAVIIHSPEDYADISSGGAQEVFPPEGQESFVSITARLIDTDEALRSYGSMTRRCLFDDEAPSRELLHRNVYSFTNCISRCRIRSIRALCNCVPFFMPLDLTDTTDGFVYCTLQHVNCLLRYTFKWRNVLTQQLILPELRREREESLFCPSCMPSCDDVQYKLSLMSLPLDRFRTSTSYNRLRSLHPNLGNFSVLRVHFREPHSLYYRRVIGNAWFEVVSTIGNILSIFIGFSLLAVFEILYYIFKYFIIACKKFLAQGANHDNNRRDKRKKHAKFSDEPKLIIYP